jgi:hypothetical protein
MALCMHGIKKNENNNATMKKKKTDGIQQNKMNKITEYNPQLKVA